MCLFLDFTVIEAGLLIPLLRHNESLEFVFEFQLDPDLVIEDLLVFGFSTEFSNLEGIV